MGSVIVSEGSIPIGVPTFSRVVDAEWHLETAERDDRQRIHPRSHIKEMVQKSTEVSGKTYVIVVPEEVCTEHANTSAKASREQG